MKKHFLAGGVLLATFALVAAACGSDSDDSADSTTTTSPTATTSASTAAPSATAPPAPTTDPPTPTPTTARPTATTAPSSSQVQYPTPQPVFTTDEVIAKVLIRQAEIDELAEFVESPLFAFLSDRLFGKLGFGINDIADPATWTDQKKAELGDLYNNWESEYSQPYGECLDQRPASQELQFALFVETFEEVVEKVPTLRAQYTPNDWREFFKYAETADCPGWDELNEAHKLLATAVLGEEAVQGCDYGKLTTDREIVQLEILLDYDEALVSHAGLEDYAKEAIRCFGYDRHLASSLIHHFGPFGNVDDEQCVRNAITSDDLGTRIIDLGIDVNQSRVRPVSNRDFRDEEAQLLKEIETMCSTAPNSSFPTTSAVAEAFADLNSSLTDFTKTCLEEHLHFGHFESSGHESLLAQTLGFCQQAEDVLADNIPTFSDFEAICFAQTFHTVGYSSIEEVREEARRILHTYCTPLALTIEQIPNLTKARSICMAEHLNVGDYRKITSDTSSAVVEAAEHMIFTFRTQCNYRAEDPEMNELTRFVSVCLEEVLDPSAYILNMDVLFLNALLVDKSTFYRDRLEEALDYCNQAEAKVNETFNGTPNFAEFEAICVASGLNIDDLREGGNVHTYDENHVSSYIESLVQYCSVLEMYLERAYPDESPAQEICFAEYLADVGKVDLDQGLTQLVADGQAVIDRAAAGACKI